MNELSGRWDAHPEWDGSFDLRDRVVVESLVRGAVDTGWHGPLSAEDDDLVVAALQLARAVRLEHVALTLGPDPLARYLARVDGADPTGVAAHLIATFARDATPLSRALVETVDLREDPAASGAPIVVATDGGVPVVAHWRSLARAECRLAHRLLSSSRQRRATSHSAHDVAQSAGDDDPVVRVTTALSLHGLVVVTGGPGTGKTTTVARVVHALGAAAQNDGRRLRVALCAPTAKAAVRLRSAVETHAADSSDGADGSVPIAPFEIVERSGSVHRLLGLRPDRAVGTDVVDADLVVVDEVSMLELPLLDQLLFRVGPETDVVLAGDPDQLASVNVGAALRDIVDAAAVGDPLARIIVRLDVNHRSDTRITDVAAAINDGNDVELARAVAAASPAVTIVDDPRDAVRAAVRHARALVDAVATDPLAAVDLLGSFAIVCATREGPRSVQWWRARIDADVRRATNSIARFAPGSPVLITRNEVDDDGDRLANGDVGVATSTGDHDDVWFGPRDRPRVRSITDVPDAESAWAITIHKSQGSEFDDVVVSLPESDSPLLTRELLYTAVTRARHSVTIVASPATIADAVRRRVDRVSGLVERLTALANDEREETSVG